jgi:hypothetical protein
MTATFDLTLSTPTDRIRAAVGDRDVPDNALRQDEEYEAQVGLAGGDERLATIAIAIGLITEFGQRVDSFSESGGIAVRWGERKASWTLLIEQLRAAIAADGTGGSGMTGAVLVRVPSGGWSSEYERGCGRCFGRTWFTT